MKIGFFTAKQLALINEARASSDFQALLPEIVFHGAHLYRSRCVRNGYTIDQVLEQIESAFSEASVVNFSASSSVLRNPTKRMDHNGNLVNDEAVFECTSGSRMRIYFQSFREAMAGRGSRKRKGHSKSDPFNVSGKDIFAWVAYSFQTSTLPRKFYRRALPVSSRKCITLF